MPKILIIGSKGFIGSHCVQYFSKDNEVWECDVILEYNKPRYVAIEALDSDYSQLFQNQKFDVCINCSGAANVQFSLSKPYNDFQLNTLNVFKFLEAIRLYNKECKFIQLSSAAVYGNPSELPIKETASASPVSPYGIHKLQSEEICKEFSAFWGIKTAILRIFSAYGVGLKKQLFWDLWQKFMNPPVELWGTGEESRDFIYVEDIIKCIELTIKNSHFKAQIVNVANGVQIKISKAVEVFASLLQRECGNSEFNSANYKFSQKETAGYPLNWQADISILKNWGYFPQINFETGIKLYTEWVKNNG